MICCVIGRIVKMQFVCTFNLSCSTQLFKMHFLFSHSHARTHAHTELQCKAATGATSAFGLHVFSMQSSWGSKHQSTTIQKLIHRRLALSLGLSMRWNMHGERVCQEKNKTGEIVWRKNIEITKSKSWHWHQNPSPTNNLIQNVIDPTSDSSVLWNARWTLFPVGATV